MACGPGAPTGEGAEPRRRRRGWARARALGGNSEASNNGLLAQRQQGQEAEPSSSSSAGRMRSCKVAPEPKEGAAIDAALPPTPGSPSFRYYCQKTSFVDRIVADTDDSDGSIGIKETNQTTHQESNRNEVTATNAQESSQLQVHEHKEGARWPRFRGLSMVASAWNNMFNRHSSSSKASPSPATESQPPPTAAAAARSPL